MSDETVRAEQISDEQVLAVECPYCNASEGDKCVEDDPNPCSRCGLRYCRSRDIDIPHEQRVDAARRLGRAEDPEQAVPAPTGSDSGGKHRYECPRCHGPVDWDGPLPTCADCQIVTHFGPPQTESAHPAPEPSALPPHGVPLPIDTRIDRRLDFWMKVAGVRENQLRAAQATIAEQEKLLDGHKGLARIAELTAQEAEQGKRIAALEKQVQHEA